MKKASLLAIGLFFALSALAWAQTYPPKIAQIVDLFPGAKVQMSAEQEGNVSTVLASSSQVKDIADFYVKAFTAKGWKQEAKVEVGHSTSISYKKDNLTFVVGITPADKGHIITLALNKE